RARVYPARAFLRLRPREFESCKPREEVNRRVEQALYGCHGRQGACHILRDARLPAMALIDLSDWLDRFAADSSRDIAPAELEGIRITAHETEPAHDKRKHAASQLLAERWSRLWRRAFRRLKRQPGGA